MKKHLWLAPVLIAGLGIGAQPAYTSNLDFGSTDLLGDGGVIGLEVSGGVSRSASGTSSGTGFVLETFSGGGSGSEDEFGMFNFKLTNTDGTTRSHGSRTANLTITSETWAEDADVLTANANGQRAAAYNFVTPSSADASNQAQATGHAADGDTTPPIPEPTSMLLLGLGLVGSGGFGIIRGRRRR